jgi:hypothetical protein
MDEWLFHSHVPTFFFSRPPFFTSWYKEGGENSSLVIKLVESYPECPLGGGRRRKSFDSMFFIVRYFFFFHLFVRARPIPIVYTRPASKRKWSGQKKKKYWKKKVRGAEEPSRNFPRHIRISPPPSRKKKNAFHFFFVMPIEKSPFDFLGYVAHYNTWWNRGGTTKIDVQKMKSPFFLTFHQIGVVVVFFYFPRVYRHIFWVVRVVGALYSFARWLPDISLLNTLSLTFSQLFDV